MKYKILFNSFLLFAIAFLTCTPVCAKEVSILLIRHGETDWNVERRVQGHTDVFLNEKGIIQAKNTADKLLHEHPDILAIYSSDLSRAYCTALATAEKLNLPIHVRMSLREINTGSSEGMKIEEKISLYQKQWNELEKKYSNKRDRWNYSAIPGEETITELIQRVKKEIISIVHLTPDKGKVAIFSHRKGHSSVYC